MRHSILFAVLLLLLGKLGYSQEDSLLFDLADDDLFSMKVKSASGIDESYLDAPATMVVISSQDIRDRGYTSLDEILMDIPGFDVNINNGTTYLNAYQRGYRTPFTQRTLLMINGKVDNHLWSHMANFSRQYPVMNIERIEVLYGPASAVYGPNAFLGVVNVITKSGKDLGEGENIFESSFQKGSNNTHSADLFSAGNAGKISYSLGVKMFRSDEEDLSGRTPFASNDLYGDSLMWGPVLGLESNGNQYGEYADPTDNWGMNGEINFGNFSIGANNWLRKEGYGAYYPGDKAQPGDLWNYSSNQFYVEHEGTPTEKFSIKTILNYRQSKVWGRWTEATPMWNNVIHSFNGDTLLLQDFGVDAANYSDYSFVSSTIYQSISDAWRINQNYNYKFSDKFNLIGGLKYERKSLTKAYDIPGYWSAFSSVPVGVGPHGMGEGIYHSLDSDFEIAPLPNAVMPAENVIFTEDLGGFLQGVYDYRSFRFQGGVRVDENSIYGVSVNPRLAGIYKLPKENGAIKLSYGEAFQEPAPIQLFGGWSGREANPDLKPEKARNLELIGMYQTRGVFQQLSIYGADYKNVIKENAENAGGRQILGGEYSVRGAINNPIGERKISLYGYYTFCKAVSETSYDFDKGVWVDSSAVLGDIAPHKFQFGMNLPIKKIINLNLRGQYISSRTPYLRNQLRVNEDFKFDGFFNLDGNLSANFEFFTFGLKIKNILNGEYFYPGPETASAGTNSAQRSLGWHNSLLPNASRNFLFYINFRY